MIEIIDLQGSDWTGWTFKSKKELKDFLQEESCNVSEYSEEEYYKENADVSLDEYCEIYQIKYVEKTRYVIRYKDYKRTHLLTDEFVDINDAESFIDSNWIGKDKKFYTIEEKS